MTKRKIPRKLSLVGFNATGYLANTIRRYPFKKERAYIFLGEIPNMPGHCVVADHRSGKIYSGYHTENFIELRNQET